MKRHKLHFDDGQMFWFTSHARFERRRWKRKFRTGLLFVVMALCIGIMFAISI